MQKIIIHSDGGARGNPGPAGIGAILHDKIYIYLNFHSVRMKKIFRPL